MSPALLPVQMVLIEHCHNQRGNRRKPRICSKPPTDWRAVGASIVIMSLFRGTKSESGDSMPSFEKQRVELLKKNDLVGVFGARHASAAIAWFELAESSFLGMRLRATSLRSRTDFGSVVTRRVHPKEACRQAALNGLCRGGAPPQRSTETNAFIETKRWPSRCAQ
jgi:hypothetical protein